MANTFEGSKTGLSKEEAQRWLEYCNAIDRLKQNPDFTMFFDVFTRSEVLRNAYLLTDVNVQMSKDHEAIERNIIESIKAGSHLRNYLLVDIERQREIAKKTIEDYEQAEQGE